MHSFKLFPTLRVGIQITHSSVYLLEVLLWRRSIYLRYFTVQPLSEILKYKTQSQNNGLNSWLKSILPNAYGLRRNMFLAIEDKCIFSEILASSSSLSEEELLSQALIKTSRELGLALNESVVDYCEIKAPNIKIIQYLLVGCSLNCIKEKETIFHNTCLRLVSIEPESHALGRSLFYCQNHQSEKGLTALLEINYADLKLYLFTERLFKLGESIEFQKEYGDKFHTVEGKNHSKKIIPSSSLLYSINIETLEDALKKIYQSFKDKLPPNQPIYICGELANRGEVTNKIKQIFNINIRSLNPFQYLSLENEQSKKLERLSLVLPVVFGLILRNK